MTNQKETIENLLQMLTLSCRMMQWQIARDILNALRAYGFTYKTQDEYAVFAISGVVYRVPLTAPEQKVPDFTLPLDKYKELPLENTEHVSDTPLYESVPADGLLAGILKDMETGEKHADAFDGMFHSSGLDELEKLEQMYGSGEEVKPDPIDYFPTKDTDSKDMTEPESEVTGIDVEAPLADFSRMDADGMPEKTPTFRSHRSDGENDTGKGFLPPLTSEIENNYSIPLSDCVYSIFLADVYEEQAINKQRIFFMVAPFEVTEDSPSTNILFYAYTDHVPYCTTSLKNHEKNSLVCQIGQFQFLVRGFISNGKWQAEVKLTGESLRRGDVLEIKQVKHFSPDSLGQTNGHIRFRYRGYINRPDLTSTGCVNIFPIDPNTKDCVIVRCMEDFIDYAFTDQKELKLQTAENGIKQLHVSCEDDTLYATFSDYTEIEEGELTT